MNIEGDGVNHWGQNLAEYISSVRLLAVQTLFLSILKLNSSYKLLINS